VIDGPTLVAEALAAGVELDEVLAEPGAPQGLLDRAEAAGAAVRLVPDGILAKVTDTVTPQAVAAVARFPAFADGTVGEALAGLSGPELVLVLVGVNDPGNAGTLLRSAEAAGAEVVVFCDDAVDPYNPKCVRGSAGSLFRLRVVRSVDSRDAVAALADRGIRSLGTVVRGGTPYDQVDLAAPTAVVLGSEAHGLAPELADRLDVAVTIPMRGGAESLNVGMAGTVICFEALRQRRAAGPSVEAAGAATAVATTAVTASETTKNRLDGAPSTGAGFSAA
jgi:TrmH family RNA methyltransferase